MKADWSFFETDHGKGPVDGVGGEIKCVVWKAVLQGKAVVSDCESFFKTAKDLVKKIVVFYVQKARVEVLAVKRKERYEASKVVPDTRVLHYICADGNEVMFSQNLSFSKPATMKRF